MEPYTVEALVAKDGSVTLPVVPFAPGTKLLVTLEEAEPMDREAFNSALETYYQSRTSPS